LDELYEKLQKIEVKMVQVSHSFRAKIHWVRLQLVCEVEFLELIKSEKLRVSAFLRMRDDKDS